VLLFPGFIEIGTGKKEPETESLCPLLIIIPALTGKILAVDSIVVVLTNIHRQLFCMTPPGSPLRLDPAAILAPEPAMNLCPHRRKILRLRIASY
jgi:hypothetical protein